MTDDLAVRCAKALHVITPTGQILSGGRAGLCVLDLLGYKRVARLFSLPPLVWITELVYWIVARNRRFFSWFFFRADSRSP